MVYIGIEAPHIANIVGDADFVLLQSVLLIPLCRPEVAENGAGEQVRDVWDAIPVSVKTKVLN